MASRRIETRNKRPEAEDLDDARVVGFQPPNQTGMAPTATRSNKSRKLGRAQASDIRDTWCEIRRVPDDYVDGGLNDSTEIGRAKGRRIENRERRSTL